MKHMSSCRVSGVDSDTRGMRLFQGGRPVEIGATGDTRRHPGLGGLSAQHANELAVVTRPLRDMAKTANPCQSGAIPGLTLQLLISMALTGCSQLPTSTLHRELAWQGLNIADGVQTSQYRHNDCHETGTWRYITGPEPTVERTVLAAGINGALHFAITYALERFDAPRGLKRAWGYTTLGLTGGQVAYNASLECAR